MVYLRSRRWLALALVGLMALGAAVAWATRAADPFTGTFEVGGQPSALALDTATGHLFVASRRDQLVETVDTATGQVLRRSPVFGVPVALIVVASLRRAAVLLDPVEGLGSVTATVGLFDTTTGALLHTVSLGRGAVDGGGANGAGHVWLADAAVDEAAGHLVVVAGGPAGHTAFLLATRDGQVLRATRVGANPSRVAVDPRTHRAFVVNTDDGTVSVLDTRDGALLATRRVGSGPLAVAVDSATGRAFVTNSVDATVSVLDSMNGRVLRTVGVVSMPNALVVAPRSGRAFVLSEDSTVISMLDGRRGVVLKTYHSGARQPVTDLYSAPQPAVVDAAGQRIFLVEGGGPSLGYQAGPFVTNRAHGGAVRVLSARDGRLLERQPVGLSPLTLAVDERTGRVFVLNVDGGRPPVVPTLWDRLWSGMPPAIRAVVPWHAAPAPASRGGSVTVLST